MVELENGTIPTLNALSLHNSTLYKWNRLCYGITNKKPHFRIENRYIPSGPTVKDEVANTMFWIGLMQGMPDDYTELWKKIPSQKVFSSSENITRREYINLLREQSLSPLYIGHLDTKDKNKQKYLKIFDFTTIKNKNTSSKRNELRGKVCSSFGSIKILIDIKKYLENEIHKLSIPNFKIEENTKSSKRSICIQIEFLLRILDTYSKKIWIIDYSFGDTV